MDKKTIFFLYVLGAALLVLGIWKGQQAYVHSRSGIRVDAVVVDTIKRSMGKSPGIDLVVEFTARDGQRITTSLQSTPVEKTVVGDKLTIHYDQNKPTDVWIQSWWQQWFTPVVLVVMGVFLAGLGYLLRET